LLHNGARIPVRETLDSARADPNSITSATASFDPNEIVADTLKLFFDALRSSSPDTNYTDERSHADNNTKHRQGTSHPIPKQGSQGFLKNGVEKHVDFSIAYFN
jgi:hypothetical protein